MSRNPITGCACLLASALAACAPAPTALVVDLDVLGADSADPLSLDFGELLPWETAERLLTIRNVGTAPASFDGLEVQPADFSLPNPDGRVLQPGASYQLPIVLRPGEPGNASGTLRFTTTDPDEPVISVLLDGVIRPSGLLFSPDGVEFDDLHVDCTDAAEVLLWNGASRSVEISQLQTIPPVASGWTVQMPQAVPFTMEPGDSVALPVQWAPVNPGVHEIELFLRSDGAPPEGLSVSLRGLALPVQQQVETTLVGDERLDLVLVIDEPSDVPSPEAIGAASEGLFPLIEQWTSDWRIFVVSMDPEQSPLLVGGAYIDSSSASPGAELTATLQQMVDTGVPRAFDTVYAALGGTGLSDEESLVGVLREDANLSLVFVTNSREQSTQSAVATAGAFVQWLQTTRGGRPMVHDITGGLTGCSGGGGSATAGIDYLEATVRTGGASSSICDPNLDWSFVAIAEALEPLHVQGIFLLGRDPDPATIEVLVAPAGGSLTPVSSGWTWDPQQNAVVFDSASRPVDGETVQVRYFEPECS